MLIFKSMKFLTIIMIFFVLSNVEAKDKPNILIKNDLVVNGKKYNIVIESTPSKPRSNGKGYCGAGEEITLRISSSGKNKFSKLIESCLENLVLKDSSAYGNQTAKSLLFGVNISQNPIMIYWDMKADKSNAVGRIDLSLALPDYSEVEK